MKFSIMNGYIQISSFCLNIVNENNWLKHQRKIARLCYNMTFHLYVQLSYSIISYLRKNTYLRKDTAFLYFLLRESSENLTFAWNGNTRELTKIWSFLSFSLIFVRRKFFFSSSVAYTLCSCKTWCLGLTFYNTRKC